MNEIKMKGGKKFLCFATLTAKNGVIALAVEKTIAGFLITLNKLGV